MARKKPAKSKANAKAKGQSSKKRGKKNGGTEAPGAGLAFLLGLAGALALVTLFLPWFNAKDTIIYGYQVLTSFDALPQAVQAGFKRVNDTFYMLLLVFTAVSAVGIGFAWPKLAAREGHARTGGIWLATAIAIGSIIEGIILLLVLLNMKAAPTVQWTGRLAAMTLFAIGLLSLLFVRVIDEQEGRDDGALPTSDWAIWLGALAGTALLHYRYVCYGLVQKAPEALMTKLRTFR